MVSASFEFQSVVCGHHVYKDIWKPIIDEDLSVKKEDDNEHDCYVLAVIHNFDEGKDEAEEMTVSEEIVGHVPTHKTAEAKTRSTCRNTILMPYLEMFIVRNSNGILVYTWLLNKNVHIVVIIVSCAKL